MTTRGFTLIELIIAVAVFAVISVVVFTGLSATLGGGERVAREAEWLGNLQRAFATVGEDLGQVAPRPVRNTFGEREPPVLWRENELWVTRGGRERLLDPGLGNLQRVGYALDEEDGLLRLSHQTADQPIGAEPERRVILDGVDDLRFRFHTGEEWIDEWPPINAAADEINDLPAAIAIRIDLEDHGTIERSFRLP